MRKKGHERKVVRQTIEREKDKGQPRKSSGKIEDFEGNAV